MSKPMVNADDDFVEVVVWATVSVEYSAVLPRKKASKIKSTWNPLVDKIMNGEDIKGCLWLDVEYGDPEANSFRIRELPELERRRPTDVSPKA